MGRRVCAPAVLALVAVMAGVASVRAAIVCTKLNKKDATSREMIQALKSGEKTFADIETYWTVGDLRFGERRGKTGVNMQRFRCVDGRTTAGFYAYHTLEDRGLAYLDVIVAKTRGAGAVMLSHMVDTAGTVYNSKKGSREVKGKKLSVKFVATPTAYAFYNSLHGLSAEYTFDGLAGQQSRITGVSYGGTLTIDVNKVLRRKPRIVRHEDRCKYVSDWGALKNVGDWKPMFLATAKAQCDYSDEDLVGVPELIVECIDTFLGRDERNPCTPENTHGSVTVHDIVPSAILEPIKGKGKGKRESILLSPP